MRRQRSKRDRAPQYKESFLQEQFAYWLDCKGILYNASMAGVNLGFAAAIRRKKMGAKRGFPDIFIYHAVTPYHGLAIELKAGDGRASIEQLEWAAKLEAHGYKALVQPSGLGYVEGFEWLRTMTQLYLDGKLDCAILNEGGDKT